MKKILLLTTGGTIASGESGGGLAPVLSSEDFLQYVKEFEGKCELHPREVCSIDSTNMRPEYWQLLVRTIREAYEEYDAFLICHGTDTLAYTAAALSYMIQESQKPIVLTGAQKSILSEITDARKNLHDSILCALDEKSRGVMVVFDGNIIAGTRAKKTSTFSYNAFSSINFPVLGKVQNDAVIYYFEEKEHAGDVRFYEKLNTRVFLLKLTPGMNEELIPYILEKYDCVIVESFGVGGLPDRLLEVFARELEKYPSYAKILVMATQVTYEGSQMDTYVVGQQAKETMAFLETYDMTLEASLAKLMWILGQKIRNYGEIERLFYSRINYDIYRAGQ